MKINKYINQDSFFKYVETGKQVLFVSFILLTVWGLMLAFGS